MKTTFVHNTKCKREDKNCDRKKKKQHNPKISELKADPNTNFKHPPLPLEPQLWLLQCMHQLTFPDNPKPREGGREIELIYTTISNSQA